MVVNANLMSLAEARRKHAKDGYEFKVECHAPRNALGVVVCDRTSATFKPVKMKEKFLFKDQIR